jgi:hypothetical protein
VVTVCIALCGLSHERCDPADIPRLSARLGLGRLACGVVVPSLTIRSSHSHTPTATTPRPSHPSLPYSNRATSQSDCRTSLPTLTTHRVAHVDILCHRTRPMCLNAMSAPTHHRCAPSSAGSPMGLFMSSPPDEYRQLVPVLRCLPQASTVDETQVSLLVSLPLPGKPQVVVAVRIVGG